MAATNAHAQGTTAVEEIVVVAQKRGENLQKVPIAVSAVTAESAKKLGVTDVQSLVSLVPGLNMNRQSVSAIPFIRGIGSAAGSNGNEPSVAFYIDDVYKPYGAASFSNFANIDRIEVLKGPQGTLFGRNATGGVVQVFTKDPGPEFSADVSLGYANYDTYNASVYVNAPITTKLSGNISGYWGRQYKGWGRNLTTGNEAYRSYYWGGRTKFLLEPSDRTSILLAADYDATWTGQGVTYRPRGNTGVLNPFPPFSGGFKMPAGASFYDTIDAVDPQGGSNQGGGSVKITHEFDAFTIKSITSYRRVSSLQKFGYNPAPFFALPVHIQTHSKTLTEEFQILSPQDSALTWIAGIFYYHDKADFNPLQFSGALLPLLIGPAPATFAQTYGFQTSRSISGFGQATANILENTRLTAGIRYTVDKRTMIAYADLNGGAKVFAPNSPQEKSFPKLTGRIAIDHQINDDVMAYVAYNRGFKSGIFNLVVFPFQPIEEAVNPEVLDAYTAGFKSQFFDDRLRFNTEAFYYEASNLQLQRFVAGSTRLANAGSAKFFGIDVDVTAVPIENLTLTASLELLSGKYESLNEGFVNDYGVFTGGNPSGHLANLRGNHGIQTPPFTMSLSGSYRIPTEIGAFDINASWFHGGNYFFDADNGEGQVPPSGTETNKQPIVDLVNASVGWTAPKENLAARIWIKNALGEEYIAFGTETLFLQSLSAAAPRTFGITVDLHL